MLTALSVVFASACGEKEFTVRFYSNGGTLVSGQEIQTVTSASEIIPPVYERAGYLLSFDKIIKNIDKDTEVFAVWSAINYKLSFDGDGGTFYNKTLSVVLGEKLPDLPEPEKEGYIFDGWTVGEEKIFSGYTWNFTSDQVAKANYVINDGYTYSITYDIAGGTLENPKTHYTFKDETFVLLEPQKTGYEFLGWVRQGETTINKVVTIEKGSIGDLKFTAVYSAKNYIIDFNANGGTAVSSTLNVTFDKEIGALPTAQRQDYIFLGWFNGETQILSGQKWNVADNVTLVAKWKEEDGRTYTITYDLAGGQLDNPKNSYSFYEEDFYLPTPLRDGYVFIGYVKEGESEPKKSVTIKSGSTGNLKFTAVWKREFTLRFELSRKVQLDKDDFGVPKTAYCRVNGNSYYQDITITMGDVIFLPVPTLENPNEYCFYYSSERKTYRYWIIDVPPEELNGRAPDAVGYEIFSGDEMSSEIEKFANEKGVIIVRPRIRAIYI